MRPHSDRNADGGVLKDSKGKKRREEEKKEETTKSAISDIAGTAQKKPETIIQYIIRQYKKALGVPEDDKAWDKARFSRLAKPAAAIVEAFNGDQKYAADWSQEKIASWSEWARKNGKSFSLERIAEAAQDAKGRYNEIKAEEDNKIYDKRNTGKTMGTDNAGEPRTDNGPTPVGNVAGEEMRRLQSSSGMVPPTGHGVD
jgi:hypothetical protein